MHEISYSLLLPVFLLSVDTGMVADAVGLQGACRMEHHLFQISNACMDIRPTRNERHNTISLLSDLQTEPILNANGKSPPPLFLKPFVSVSFFPVARVFVNPQLTKARVPLLMHKGAVNCPHVMLAWGGYGGIFKQHIHPLVSLDDICWEGRALLLGLG